MRQVLGDIRNSIFKEITDRADEIGVLEELDVKDSNLIIKYQQNQINGIGFKKSSLDLTAKLKSLAGYNCVIIEEADEIQEDEFLMLDDSLRTMKGEITIFFLFNPPDKGHWLVKRFFNLEASSEADGFYNIKLKDSCKENTILIHTTYLDNIKNISQSTINNYENYKLTRPDHYFNMIRGLVSSGKRGLVFKSYKTISDKEFDELTYPSFYGLDFGFSADPSALTEIKEHNENVWARELIYETGLINVEISKRFEQLGVSKGSPIYADSQEAKSIEELKRMGWNIMPCVKGKGSVNAGIDMLLGKVIHITESSKNIANEFLNYAWALDRNKEPTNDPIDKFNHCFVYDTEINTNCGMKKIGEVKVGDLVFTRNGYKKVVKIWDNGLKQVKDYWLHLDTDMIKLRCTNNHLILTNKGWKPISKLKSGMTIFYIKNLTERHINFIQKKGIFQEGQKGCTKQFGNFIVVKYLKDLIYTIKIKTLGIIVLKILSWLKNINTYQITERGGLRKILNGLNYFIKTELKKQKNGIIVKTVDNGIVNMERNVGLEENTKSLSVKNVEKNMKHDTEEFQNFVILTAKLKHLEKGENYQERVFDLTVADCHEYFANGLLVHNCIDSLRYGVYTKNNAPYIGF
jgi:phage terminase large subunit